MNLYVPLMLIKDKGIKATIYGMEVPISFPEGVHGVLLAYTNLEKAQEDYPGQEILDIQIPDAPKIENTSQQVPEPVPEKKPRTRRKKNG